MSTPAFSLLGTVQMTGALAASLLVVLLPPARGTMVLVPITTQGNAEMVGRAIADGAALLGRGPMTGSIVVVAERHRIAWDMLAHGVVILPGDGGCGATKGRAA